MTTASAKAKVPVDVAEIRALAGIVSELDYYELLEVARDAPSSSIRTAYHSATRRFHPDVVRDIPDDARSAIRLIAKRVSEAYSVLRDPRRRKIYDQRIESGDPVRMPLVEAEAEAGRRGREAQDGRTENGRRYYAKVRSDLARGDKDAAWRNLQMALTFEPKNEFFKELQQKLRLGA